MKKIKQIIRQLEKSTSNIYLKKSLENLDEDEFNENDLCLALEFIIKDGYDIDGYMLFEIPTNNVYCFVKSPNTPEMQCFDIYTNWNGKSAIAGYISGGEMCEANSIQEAIAKFG